MISYRTRGQRSPDPLATPEAVREICQQLTARHAPLRSFSQAKLARLLYAVAHVETRPTSDSKRGRPPQWPREELLAVASLLRGLLEHRTGGRISLPRFIYHYLQILTFPQDVAEALTAGQMTLMEAAALARLTPANLGVKHHATARQWRAELLRAHLAARGSQNALRARVAELLDSDQQVANRLSATLAESVAEVDAMLEIDPSDVRQLFWEQIKYLIFGLRAVRPDELDEEILERLNQAMSGVFKVMQELERRRQPRQQKTLL